MKACPRQARFNQTMALQRIGFTFGAKGGFGDRKQDWRLDFRGKPVQARISSRSNLPQ